MSQSLLQDVYQQDSAAPAPHCSKQNGPEQLPGCPLGAVAGVPGVVRCNRFERHRGCTRSCSTGKVLRWPKLQMWVRIKMFKFATNILGSI